MKRIFACVLCVALLLTGCVQKNSPHTATYFDLFDTVTTIRGTGNEKFFREQAQSIHEKLTYYHRLFDIYAEYPGVHNLKTVNDQAGLAPVKVDRPVIELLLFCRDMEKATAGKVNVAMGSVLSLWHEARTRTEAGEPQLPSEGKLQAAANHRDFSQVIIDEENSTVFLADPQMSLDVGAIAKGWSAQQVARQMPEGMMLSVGGNVCITGPKNSAPWIVGIQNPRGEGTIQTIALRKGSAVTSGDYQRTFSVQGKNYHHIIDPQTLYPSEYWTSVTVVCADSGVADALSTALFVTDQQEGQKLLTRFGAEAMWVDGAGNCVYSAGFLNLAP